MESRPVKVEVAAGLLFREGRLLITQRLAGTHLAGMWEFPGGKRHPQESFSECLKRELLEELAIEVQVHERLASEHHRDGERDIYLEFYRCTLIGGTPQRIGVADFTWIKADELERYAFPPADTLLLERLRNSPDLWVQPGSSPRPSQTLP